MATPNLVAGPIAGGFNSLTPKVLASAQMASGDNTVYTVPANSAARITTATICNTTGTAVTVSLALVPSGGSVDGTHRVISGYSLPANESLSLNDYLDGAQLGQGDYISVNVGTGAAVDVVITGLVMT